VWKSTARAVWSTVRGTSLVLFCSLIRRETALFFGVEESKDEEEQARWLDRRRRLAARRYGSLKDECQCSDTQRPLRHQQHTSAYTTQASTRVRGR
jgi:hypothetical protein